MKQDVTVDGIPTHIQHDHNVVLEIKIDEETAIQIKNIAITVFTIAATTAIAKSLGLTANRILLEREYHKLWKVR